MGWYGSTASDAARITRITTVGDVTLHGRWNRVYTITFYNDGTLMQTFNLCVGDTFTTPSPTKEHYHGVWNGVANDATVYADVAFGSVLTLTTAADVRFDAAWSGNVYTITYKQAYGNYCPTQTYTFGTTTYLLDPIVQDESIFLGYYTDENFTVRVTEIGPTEYDDKEIYVKWDVHLASSHNTGDHIITDDGRWQNYYKELRMYFDYTDPYSCDGFQTLRIDITMKMKEIDDGYQYIMLFTEEGNDDSKIYDCQIEYYPGEKHTNAETIGTFHIYIDINDIKDCDYLYLAFGASGSGDDDWCIEKLDIEMYYSHDPANASVNEHYVYPEPETN